MEFFKMITHLIGHDLLEILIQRSRPTGRPCQSTLQIQTQLTWLPCGKQPSLRQSPGNTANLTHSVRRGCNECHVSCSGSLNFCALQNFPFPFSQLVTCDFRNFTNNWKRCRTRCAQRSYCLILMCLDENLCLSAVLRRALGRSFCPISVRRPQSLAGRGGNVNRWRRLDPLPSEQSKRKKKLRRSFIPEKPTCRH